MLSVIRIIAGYGADNLAGSVTATRPSGSAVASDLGTSYDNGYNQVTCLDDEDDLLSAVKANNLGAVKYLIADGADAGVKDEVGRTPLHMAVKKGLLDFIPVLMSGGADPNAQDNHGYTPLHLACAAGNSFITRKLLEFGAQVECTDTEGKTPLHIACVGTTDRTRLASLLAVLRVLIERKPDLDFRDEEGLAPIHIATMTRNVDAVQVLLIAGANRALPDKSDRRPFDIATSRGFRRIIQLLVEEDNKAQLGKLKQYDKYLK